MRLRGAGVLSAEPGRGDRSRRRFHPPGTEPLHESEHRGQPVHRPFPPAWEIAFHQQACREEPGQAVAGVPEPGPRRRTRSWTGSRRANGSLVEIAKALSTGAEIIIFDEPTTSLTAGETERLFGTIQDLRRQGKSMIYISHNLGNVLQLADDIVVLRDGRVVDQGPREDFTVDTMISRMVGRDISQIFPSRASAAGRGDRPGGPGPVAAGDRQGYRSDAAQGRGAGALRAHGLGTHGTGPHPLRPGALRAGADSRRRRGL